MKRWVKRAGIDKHISWHCARHSFAVNILNNGANIKTVASLLGHSGLKHTEKYTRAVDKLKEEAINSLPELKFNHKRLIFVIMDFEALVKHISTIQNTLQAQAAHAVNLALTSRNWLMGCYIVEFEQNGEDRAAYGEQLLKKLEQRLKTKGLNERRFREFRRLYLVYPQLKEQVLHYIMAGNEIRHTLSAEFTEPIRHSVYAELQTPEIQYNKWSIPAERLFNKLPYSHLKFISKIENPTKRAFYEMEAIRGCWSARELERQNSVFIL